MIRHPTILSGFAACALLLALAAEDVAAAKIKCWTNKEGVRECGNFVPPEYAQKGHTVKSQQGVTVGETSRAKTKEELDAERAERERLAALEAERERLRKEQAAYDRVLLSTYTTEEDLALARDGKLAAIDSRIRHTEQVNAKLEETLAELQAEAAKLERSGKTLTEKLQRELSSVQKQVEANQAGILARTHERDEIRAKFEADLERYRELRGRSTSARSD